MVNSSLILPKPLVTITTFLCNPYFPEVRVLHLNICVDVHCHHGGGPTTDVCVGEKDWERREEVGIQITMLQRQWVYFGP